MNTILHCKKHNVDYVSGNGCWICEEERLEERAKGKSLSDRLRDPELYVDASDEAANRLDKLEAYFEKATTFTIELHNPQGLYLGKITIEKRDVGKWAVCHNGFVLDNEGYFVLEPLPSNRDDKFLKSTRYSFGKAWHLAHKEASKKIKAYGNAKTYFQLPKEAK